MYIDETEKESVQYVYELNEDRISKKDFLMGCSLIALSRFCNDEEVLKETAEKFVDSILK